MLRPRRIAAAMAVILLLWIAREFWLAWTAAPGPPIDYAAKLHDIVVAHQPADGDNAWPHLQRAGELITRISDELRAGSASQSDRPIYVDFYSLTTPDHYDRTEGRQRADQVRATARQAMALFEAQGGLRDLEAIARARRAVRPPRRGSLMSAVLDPTSGTAARRVLRICGARMWEAHRSKDRAVIAQSFEQALALSNAVWQQGTLFDYLVGVAMRGFAISNMQQIAMERTLPADTLRECLAALDRHPPPPLSLTIEGMRLETLDAIQQAFTDDGRGGGRLIPQRVRPLLVGNSKHLINRLPNSPISNVTGFYFEGRRTTTGTAERFYEGLARLATVPRSERARVFDDTAFLDSLSSSRQPLLACLLRLSAMQIGSRDRHETEERGLRAVLAIETWRMENRSYPDHLGVLSPAILPEVPIDPFSGRPLCYRRLPGGDTDGRYYLLWSVGNDGADDGGRQSPDGNIRAFRTSPPVGGDVYPFVGGYDFIINEPWRDD